jgi:hypothetical protein
MRRPERPVFVPVAPTGHRRQWKIALSLAIVGVLAAPFVFRTYKFRPTYPAAALQKSFQCRESRSICEYNLRRDVEHERRFDPLKYIAVNVGVAAATFVSFFALAFLTPMFIHGLAFLARRYWKWLNA